MREDEQTHRSFLFSYRVRVPEAKVREQPVSLWLPMASSGPTQEVTQVHVEATGEQSIHADPDFGNAILFVQFPAGSSRREVALEYHVRRRSVRTAPPDQTTFDPPIDPDQMNLHLRANLNVPTDGFIAQQATMLASPDEPPLEIAHRFFEHLIETLDYDWAGCPPHRLAELGNLRAACDLRQGTCTDFHGLFVGYLRSLGIPARFVFGFNIPRDKSEGRIAGYHCWAEVFVPGGTWFPVDVSEGWKADDKRGQYFGGLDCHRLELCAGRDIRPVPRTRKPMIDKFIYGHAEAGRASVDLEYEFDFRDA